jgi:hypothetical protein
MRQPLTAAAALEFMNAAIKNTSYEKEVVEQKTTLKKTKKDSQRKQKNTGEDFCSGTQYFQPNLPPILIPFVKNGAS